MTIKLPMAQATTMTCERLHATISKHACAKRYAGSRVASAYATGRAACMGCPVGEANAKAAGIAPPVERRGSAMAGRWRDRREDDEGEEDGG